jgi:hypothetical protein
MSSVAGMLTAVVLAFAVSACGSARSQSHATAPAPTTVVEVTNNNWATMVVYVLRPGARIRLGMVNSQRTERFTVPPAVVPTAGPRRISSP